MEGLVLVYDVAESIRLITSHIVNELQGTSLRVENIRMKEEIVITTMNVNGVSGGSGGGSVGS